MTDSTSVATESLPYAASRPAASSTARARIEVIDVMRGLVMVIMLLDHVRETFYLHKQVSDPMDVATTEPSLFFSRLAAHFCAPMFVFLTGMGAWLYANPSSGPRSPTGFLVKRGLLLIFLEITLVTFAWNGKFPPPTIWLQVIWVIGLCMIILGLVHALPRWLLAVAASALVFGHNALSAIHVEPGQAGYVLWTILHDRGFLIPEGFIKLKVSYPLLPWIGVILFGWLAGPLYARSMEAAKRDRILTLTGVACLALLALLRGFNIYGETLPWTVQQDATHTAMSFLNYTKYPPSLDFLLLTLGVGFLVFPRLEALSNGFTRMLATFGGAPMFYYLFHLYLLLALQLLLVALLGANHGDRFGLDEFWPVWLISIALVPVLYFPCRAFARFKRTSSQAWVRYF
ncbi:MAG TPA: heparan-alpha-glucosaminide N-acetyltransferase domain-containing protein [Usitatibacter sp.]|nr:heparan-alpha-glucosaminide N-acetyltransferase domain-containing protein [Usitatibacter sp.]